MQPTESLKPKIFFYRLTFDSFLERADINAESGKGTSEPSLYNLAEDIGEQNNLAEKIPEKVKELQGKWDEWNQANVKPLFGGNNLAMNMPGNAIELADDDEPEPAWSGSIPVAARVRP